MTLDALDLWDWADVAALAVVANRIAPDTSRAHRAGLIGDLGRQVAHPGLDAVDFLRWTEWTCAAAGLRQGSAECAYAFRQLLMDLQSHAREDGYYQAVREIETWARAESADLAWRIHQEFGPKWLRNARPEEN